MPKHERKVNPGKVTRLTWITKETTRGETTRLARLPNEPSQRASQPCPSVSPMKGTPSRSALYHGMEGDDEELCFEALQPLKFPVTKADNDYLRDWLPYQEEFLRCILDMEAPPTPLVCHSCGANGTCKCGDCFGSPMLCKPCMAKSHRLTPFHRPREWTGKFFEETTLHSILEDPDWEDISIAPNYLRPPANDPCITIVDVTGVHFITVNYCSCLGSPPAHLQLLRQKLFPATIKSPRTCFTFGVLDDFIRDNLECGTSVMNYYSKIRRITSNVFPDAVPNRVTTVAHLEDEEMGGVGHRACTPVPGELALFCPTCPQPGINADPSPNDLADWKYTQTFIMDGNFKAEHLHEKRSDNQVWLMDGQGFMVTRPEYKEYLQDTNHPLEKSACNNHRAVNQANASHGKLESTGIGATACARHGCFVPHTVVDFQKGERQVNMDYSFTNALKYNMGSISRVILFYDINCSYMKKLRSQMMNSQFIQLPANIDITPGIGIWHVHGHRPECFPRYAPLYIPGSGWVDGEIIETLWSILNVISKSARGMSSPYQQELLDFQMNDSNFMKMIRMTQSLRRKYLNARLLVNSSNAAFNDLNSTVSEEHRNIWLSEEATAQRMQATNPSAMDTYQLRLQRAPTIQAVELRLLKDETGSDGGAATWLARGLKVEEGQLSLAKDIRTLGSHSTDIQRLTVARRADRLNTDISVFLSEAPIHLGEGYADELLSDESADESEAGGEGIGEAIGGQRPDLTKLPLPSALGRKKMEQLDRLDLVKLELELREGQANDALHDVRLVLIEKAVFHAKKTRAWDKVHAVNLTLARHAAIYRKCRQAMVHLGADDDRLKIYQPLSKEDLKATTSVLDLNSRGLRYEGLAWFWSLDVPRDAASNDWMSEFYRVHWLRAKAVRDRWAEEKELLEAEFQWTINFFGARAGIWEYRSILRFKSRSSGSSPARSEVIGTEGYGGVTGVMDARMCGARRLQRWRTLAQDLCVAPLSSPVSSYLE
ncbi:hypothetical protein L210DRAFT_3614647 [Boletus edulis BED1]|uniref:CxC2-like cysteine cluster KDZ transposase-associated domain-containing protein n=1 Tax=Boletus edulis BED1 TaxID=1328754 RepID=A0AAD4BHD0_BOLED|nr:hypothetical protein L210DRAFT_3614647 [Boletus edulis BED1]